MLAIRTCPKEGAHRVLSKRGFSTSEETDRAQVGEFCCKNGGLGRCLGDHSPCKSEGFGQIPRMSEHCVGGGLPNIQPCVAETGSPQNELIGETGHSVNSGLD